MPGSPQTVRGIIQPTGKSDITIIRPLIYSEVGEQKVDEKTEGEARVELNWLSRSFALPNARVAYGVCSVCAGAMGAW
jgi:hypothetical protein